MMRLTITALFLSMFALAQPSIPPPTAAELESAHLQSLAGEIKDALSHGNVEGARKVAANLSIDVADYDERLRFQRLDASLPAAGPARFDKLSDLAKVAVVARDYLKAETYARELLRLAPDYRDDQNYGNAIYNGNLVLGRVALIRDRNVEEAKNRLKEAGKTPGSAVLNSFGPNMTLARDLLEVGESGAVADFFEQCRTFWKARVFEHKLNEWTAIIKTCCRMPDFGPNLVY
jgi:hypothetical protein